MAMYYDVCRDFHSKNSQIPNVMDGSSESLKFVLESDYHCGSNDFSRSS